MARYKVLYWREIPSQLKVRDEAGPSRSYPLPDWFLSLIDRKTGTRG